MSPARGGRRAVITGLGAVSGFGVGAERLWQSLAAGRRAVRPAEALRALGLEGVLATVPVGAPGDSVGEDGGSHLRLNAGDRATAMALVAADEAARDAGALSPGDRLAVALGTTLGGIGVWLDALRGQLPWSATSGWTWSGPASAVASAHGAGGPLRLASTACASSNAALGEALDLIRSGRAHQVLAGGVDALSDFVVTGFASLKAVDPDPCRPFDRARRGLNLGEGACFLVVEEETHARARGARIRAFLDGYGDASDANHMTGPDREGRGAARAMSVALSDAALDAEAVDFVSAHGTATRFNDLMESHALALVLGARAPSVPVNSIKGAIGHTLGAAGAFEALLCVRTLETGVIAPTAGLSERDPEIDLDVVAGASRSVRVNVALSTSSGFGGTNAAVVLRRAPE